MSLGGGRAVPRTRLDAVRRMAVVAAALLTATACGSELSRQELLAANSQAFRSGAVGGTSQASNVGPQRVESSSSGVAEPGATSLAPQATAATSVAGRSVATGSPAADSSPAATGPSSSRQSARSDQPVAVGSPTPGAPSAKAQALTPASPAGGAAKEEIRIGCIGASGGVLGTAMEPVRQGAIAWAADVNARGGLNGHPVHLYLVDDQSDPRIALSLVKKLVEEYKVQAFYAIHGVVTEQSYVPYLEEKQIPIIGTSGGAGVDSVKSPIIYEANPGNPDGTAWAHALPALGLSDKRKVAVLYCREASACPHMFDVLKKGADSAGIQIVYEGQISMAQPDYTAEMLAARNAGAEIVISMAANPATVRMVASAHRQSYRPIFSTQWSANEDSFLQLGGQEVEGVVVSGVVPDYANNPKLADYRAAMDKYIAGGGRKGSFSAFTWVNGKLFEAIAGGFGATVTSADITKGLLALRRETLGGIVPPLTFAPGRGHIDTNQCIYPAKIEGGKFVYPLGERYVCPPGFKAYEG
jgi:branched-chain amino acid transport system substrate-binding protein